jgi:hypothetical protein
MTKKLRVLIGCEFTGCVRQAFRAQGHDAWSCDLLPAEDKSPHHFQCDVFEAIAQKKWDLAIFHPPCTFLTSSGLHWNHKRPERAALTEESLVFVANLLDCGIPKIALENPTGCISTRIRKYDQKIQPYEFGEDASKGTCLWLVNLPPLPVYPEERCPGRIVIHNGKEVERWSNQTDSGQNKLGPSETRGLDRSRTYPRIAARMAEIWGS